MPLFKTSRKVQSFGSSLALTIPSMYAKIYETKKGDLMNVYYNLQGILIYSKCKDEEELRKTMKIFLESLDERKLSS